MSARTEAHVPVKIAVTLAFTSRPDRFPVGGYDRTPEGMAAYLASALADGDMTLDDLFAEHGDATIIAARPVLPQDERDYHAVLTLDCTYDVFFTDDGIRYVAEGIAAESADAAIHLHASGRCRTLSRPVHDGSW